MPRYELSLIMRALERPSLVEAMKRVVTELINQGAIVRSMESLGERQLPYIMTAHAQRFYNGHYFILEVDASPELSTRIKPHFQRDVDIIRKNFVIPYSMKKSSFDCSGPYTGIYAPSSKKLKTDRELRKKLGVVE
ncbi:28S ribosomal protein S6, mitochondrial-like [Anneissia japonica]|uniref:28S ribosomal protein S6, mitochondrial-like n=1 Tax=Anneissia japonica TaxID=1529436 RepID=UPI0014257914|nr:28S ribosomal protein S6, mitochondrial-like [Anneissia japonica]